MSWTASSVNGEIVLLEVVIVDSGDHCNVGASCDSQDLQKE